jgi:hypothetical protein
MANTTVYPYGTGGTLPASIGLINDLTTGGVNKALTAEMGKEIGSILSTFPMVGLVDEDGIFFVDQYLNIGVKIDNEGLSSINGLIAEDV